MAMFSRFNIKQVIFLLFGGALSVLTLSGLFSSIETSVRIQSLILGLLFLYWTARLIYIAADPDNDRVILKSQAESSVAKGLCPFCRINRSANHSLKIGYRKPHLFIAHKILWIESWRSFDESYIHLPICQRCEENYFERFRFKLFARAGLDFSFRVLQMKRGYFRGLRFPLESWNIQQTSND
jgi:hypothetical protein